MINKNTLFYHKPMSMKNITHSLIFCAFLWLFASCTPSDAGNNQDVPEEPVSVLVFSKTSGFYHKSIPDGIAALQQLGREHNFNVDTTKNAAYFTPDSLRRYDAIIFLSTTGDVFNEAQQTAFMEYIQAGGGFVGIHSATDTEYEWPWFNRLVGAYFESHPEVQQATIRVIDKTHPATSFLPDEWQRTDEWYNFKDINPDIQVLALLDESSYTGGKNGEEHPIAWHHEFDGGRAFYTAGGHTAESYRESLFLEHIWGGIRYAAGISSTSSQ